MDDDSEYNDGDIVWVKLSYCWWPGEVMAGDRLTEEFLSTLKRRPLAVVKFFDEDSYEFVKNTNFIYKYNCNRKNEFLRKGLEQYRAKNKHMEKFPSDVMHAERATGGDPNIVNSNDFLPQKRESYAGIFGDKNKGRASTGGKSPAKKVVSPSKIIPVIQVKKHEVRILAQATSLTGISVGSRSLSSTLGAASSLHHSTPRPGTGLSSLNSSGDLVNSSSSSSPAQIYHCYKCGFESSRQNVIMIHTKYCRAIPMNLTSVKVLKPAKPTAVTPEKTDQDVTPKESLPTPSIVEEPQTPPKTAIEEKIEKIAEGEEELVEVIQVLEPKPTRGHASRTPRAAAPAVKVTPKKDRRRNRGRGRAAPAPAEDESDEKVEVLMEVTEEKEEKETEHKEEPVKMEAVVEIETEETKTVEESVEKEDKDSKVKGELKNELLADWSEDEQDDQEDPVKEDESAKNEEPDKTEPTEIVTLTAASSLETSLDKSAECSPQLASPVSSCATTIKYRNIPKKQKREFIEVTNDQPVVPVACTIEKSSSESSICTTAATCGGDTPTASDRTQTSIDSLTERPISAKQRILDRATRGSSKSVSSDEAKQESLLKVVSLESQPTADEDAKKETSCFDFQEDDEEEVVLNKSPRRSLSNRRDTSSELNSTVPDPVKEQEEQERAKKDAELKTEIESLLCETSIPSLPELPKIAKALSPVPSSSTAVETTPQLKEEIDRNRTLPPKERGKRIFKTRNKIIENEAIALEQSKAIVMDFVKKSHEEELAELLEQQRAEAKLSSISPTTTNDDSQESVLSNEPARFENSGFAAIKSKRTKISVAENALAVSDKTNIVAQEPSVSSTNETKAAETESLPVSISKDQLALDALASAPTPPKGRKGRQRKSATPVVEKPVEEVVPEVEQKLEPRVEDATPKARKKRGGELQNLDLKALDTPRSRRGRGFKAEEPAVVQEEPAKVVEEPAKVVEEPAKAVEEPAKVVEEPVVAPTSSERHRKSRWAKKEEEPEQEQPFSKGETVEEPPAVEVPTPVVEELKVVVEEPVVASASSGRHRKSKRSKKEEEPEEEQASSKGEVVEEPPAVEVPTPVVEEPKVVEEPVVVPPSSGRQRKSRWAKQEEEPEKEQPSSKGETVEEQPAMEVPTPVVEELTVVEEPVVAPTSSERHRKSKRAKEEEPEHEQPSLKGEAVDETPAVAVPTPVVEEPKVVEGPVVVPPSSGRQRKSRWAKQEEESEKEQPSSKRETVEEPPAVEVPTPVVEEHTVFEEPVVAPTSSERHRKSKRAKKEEEPEKEQPSSKGEAVEEPPAVEVPTPVVEELTVFEEPVVAPTSSERHRKSKRAKKEEEPEKEQPSSKGEAVEDPPAVEVPTPVVEELKVVEEAVVAPTSSERHRKSKRAKKEEEPEKEQPSSKGEAVEEPPAVEVPTPVVEEPKAVEEPVVAPTSSGRHRKSRWAKQEEEQPSWKAETVEEPPVVEVPTPVVEEPKEELKAAPKLKRFKQLQQRSADSTAEIVPQILDEPTVPTTEKDEPAAPVEPAPEPSPPVKQQPIKMIIKSKGRKSNSELLYEPTVVSPEPKEDEMKEKLPKSPKTSKRKKTPVEEPVEPLLVETPPVDDATLEPSVSIKSPKSKRAKLRTEPPKASDKIPEETLSSNLVFTGPSATDLQIAEALIHLPDVTPPKPVVQDQEMVEIKPNSSSPIPTTPVATAKTINPRKRHLQTLMSSSHEVVEQPPQQTKTAETVTIPEKKIRETVEVVGVAPDVTESANAAQVDEDKFDIDNIPIVMDDSELIDDSTISTTTTSIQKSSEEIVQAMPAVAKPTAKKLVIVKSSNGSSKIASSKESPPREIKSSVPKKNLGIKSTAITIKPPVEQLSPKATRSPAHSPPIRGTQLVQASSGGQIVITSKGTVLTTQSPATASARSSRTGAPKTHVTPAKAGNVVSSVSSVGTISSSTSKSPPTPSTPTSHPIKSSLKLSVQSQEIVHPPPPKVRSKAVDSATSQKKTPSSSTSPPKKILMKKHSDASSSTGGRPLFSTSKGAPIKPQPATSSAVSPGKKPHKVIKISPQKLKEFTRLGMVEDKGQGKVLTASGMKKFRQEQNQLQQQKPPHPEESKKAPRADSVDEEPSTSTPTPPPPAEAPAEVVVAAAADSSVKEIPAAPMEVEELAEVALAASSTESLERPSSPAIVAAETAPTEPSSTEENEADAAIKEPEAESSSIALRPDEKESSTTPMDDEPSESAAVAVAAEVMTEATESGSNVQESSQLIAVPAENFGGPSNLFYLCSVREEGFVPVNNELLYLDSSNQLVALPEHASVEDIVNQAEVLELPAGSEQATVVTATATVDGEGSLEPGQQNILLNTQDGQQIILDQQSLMALAAGGDTSQLLTPDGQQILLQGSAQELLAALAVSQPGLGIVAAEGTQIIVAPESLIDLQDPPLPGEIIQVNPNTTVETNAVLTKPPIMSAVEVPTKNGAEASSASSPEQRPLEPASTNLDESLAAVIGVPGNPNVPTSLELPITVTNPVIAKTTTCKISQIYPPTTAMSAMALDPALAAAGTVIGLPTVAQTDSLTAIKSIWD